MRTMHVGKQGEGLQDFLFLVSISLIILFFKNKYNGNFYFHWSEVVATKIVTEIIIDIGYMLRMLQVQVKDPIIMFCNNQSVVVSITNYRSSLTKKHKDKQLHLESLTSGWLNMNQIGMTFWPRPFHPANIIYFWEEPK